MEDPTPLYLSPSDEKPIRASISPLEPLSVSETWRMVMKPALHCCAKGKATHT